MNTSFQSLRIKLLVPLISVAVFAALTIAAFSYVYGERSAAAQIDRRFQEIGQTLGEASFPLTRPVLKMLRQLTGAELVTLARDGTLVESTLPISPERLARWQSSPGASEMLEPMPGYRLRVFPLRGDRPSAADRVVVLLDDGEIRKTQWRAAMLPLLTGMSTVLLMSLVAWWLLHGISRRISDLRSGVQRIGAGEFDAVAADPGQDELAWLNRALQRMGEELSRLWKTVHQQERQRLVHQLAAGLAHQMRNSLTGARMAVDLHGDRCHADDEGLQVARDELQRTEEYVRRILDVASPGATVGHPGTLAQAIALVRPGLETIAAHQRRDLRWELDPAALQATVPDQRSFASALQNLALNGLQAQSQRVEVRLAGTESEICLRVQDDGEGIATTSDVFEAFVTTKPEGLGLGLTLVRREAERLRGTVTWTRDHGITEFCLTFPAAAAARVVEAIPVPIPLGD